MQILKLVFPSYLSINTRGCTSSVFPGKSITKRSTNMSLQLSILLRKIPAEFGVRIKKMTNFFKTPNSNLTEKKEIRTKLTYVKYYTNSIVCLFITLPYVSFCLSKSMLFGFFYIVGLLWLFLLSPPIIIGQLFFLLNHLQIKLQVGNHI